MRLHIGIAQIQHSHGRGSHIDNAVLILKCPLDMEKLPTSHGYAVTFIELRVDDGIQYAAFIF
jgi:hypothetical protein